jgi:hypothetical protein
MNITGSSFHLRWQPLSVERVGARQADARLERGEFTHDLEEVNPGRGCFIERNKTGKHV